MRNVYFSALSFGRHVKLEEPLREVQEQPGGRGMMFWGALPHGGRMGGEGLTAREPLPMSWKAAAGEWLRGSDRDLPFFS